jgi:hypothetical protein
MYLITPEQHATIVEALDAAQYYMTDLRKPLVQSTLFIVEQLKPCTPVAYASFADNGNIRMWTKYDTASVEEFKSMQPLYTKDTK